MQIGSCAAGGLSSSATLTAITTNGTDVWLVDGYSDKVYKYAGAANRTSGSQSASATFALNPNDTNPQGIADPPPAAPRLPASTPAASLPPEGYDFAPIAVATHGGKRMWN